MRKAILITALILLAGLLIAVAFGIVTAQPQPTTYPGCFYLPVQSAPFDINPALPGFAPDADTVNHPAPCQLWTPLPTSTPSEIMPTSTPEGGPTVVPTSTPETLPTDTPEPEKVLLCHLPGAGQVTLYVDQHAVPAHLDHDDYLGECRPLPTSTPSEPPDGG